MLSPIVNRSEEKAHYFVFFKTRTLLSTKSESNVNLYEEKKAIGERKFGSFENNIYLCTNLKNNLKKYFKTNETIKQEFRS